MDRAEATGFGVALAGHAALLAILSVGFATATRPPVVTTPMEVSFVEEVDTVSAAPDPATEVPAQSVAAEFGPPEEAAPVIEPAPAPPAPLPPAPQPLPMPPKAVETPAPQPKPQPAPKPEPPKPTPPKPTPAKPAPAKPAPPKAAPQKPAAAKPAAPLQAQPKVAAAGAGAAKQTRGTRLGSDFLKGVGSDPAPSEAERPVAAMSGQARADIGSAILRQVQPCANQQVKPGPGAERIRVTINLRLNRDGSLASRPRVTEVSGVDEDNRRYADRVEDLAVATFIGCSPLRGLPEELYDVKGGWSNFSLRYKLPG
jgi:outer membrane biosynthesis protein TonB